MHRIKLPGNEKHKKIILIVLVIISIGILFHEGRTSSQNKSLQSKNQSNEQGEIIESSEKDKSNSENTINKNDEVKQEEKNYSSKENELYNEAYELFFSGKYGDAIDKANGLVSEFPNNPMGYNIRGIAKSYNKDYEGGIKDIDKALEIDEKYGYAIFNKALTYELYGNMDEALKWYNKDLEIEDYVWSYYGIASIYGRRGDVDNTMKYLNKAIQINDSVKASAKTEHDFDPVRNSKEFKDAVYN